MQQRSDGSLSEGYGQYQIGKCTHTHADTHIADTGTPHTWPSHPRLWLLEARHNVLFPWLLLQRLLCTSLQRSCISGRGCLAHYSVLIIDRAPSLGQRSHWSCRSRVGFPRVDLITPPAHSHLAPAFRMNWRGQLCSCAAGLNFHFHRFARVAQFSNGWSQQALLDLVLIMCSQEVSYANKEHAGKKTSVTFNHLARDEDDCQSRCRPCVFSRYCRNLKSFLCADQVLASQSFAASFIPLSSIKLKHLENQEHSHQTSCSH